MKTRIPYRLSVAMAALALFTLPAQVDAAEAGVVTARRLNLRASPSLARGRIMTVLPRGTQLQVEDTTTREGVTFYRVQTPQSLRGYVSSRYVQLERGTASSALARNQVSVTASALNVRSAPVLGSQVVGQVERGQRLTVAGRSGAWLQISTPQRGWVHSTYVSGPGKGGATRSPTPSQRASRAAPQAASRAAPQAAPAPSATPQLETRSIRRITRRRVGNDKLYAEVVREVVIERTTVSGAPRRQVEDTVRSSGKLLGRSFTAFRVDARVLQRETSTGVTLPLDANRATSFDLAIGPRRVALGWGTRYTQTIASAEIPVPVGPWQISLLAELATDFQLHRQLQLGSDPSVTLSGSTGIGGDLGVGVGIPGVKVGIEANVDLIRASLPATFRFERDGIHFLVEFVLSSDVHASVFARVGFGALSKKFSARIPGFEINLARTSFRVARGALIFY